MPLFRRRPPARRLTKTCACTTNVSQGNFSGQLGVLLGISGRCASGGKTSRIRKRAHALSLVKLPGFTWQYQRRQEECSTEGDFRRLALLALRHNRRVKTIAERIRQLVKFVALVNFDGFARRAVSDYAVFAFAKMLLEVGSHRSRNLFIEQFV